MEPDYEPVSREKYQALLRAIDSAKQKHQRYTGLKRDQKAMAVQMKELFDRSRRGRSLLEEG